MQFYKLRVDFNPSLDNVYIDLQNKYFTCWVRASEKGCETRNPHLHYYFETTKSSVSIRQFIRKNIGSGNGVYSLSELDEEKPIEYLAYLVKEDPNTIWFKMPAGLRDKAVAYDLGVKKDLKKKASMKIENYLREKYGHIPKHREKLVEAVIDYHLDNNLMVRQFYVQSLCQTLLLRSGDKSYRERFVSDIVSKI